MLLFEKEVAYCFATIVPSIYRPSVAFAPLLISNVKLGTMAVPREQIMKINFQIMSNSWFLYQVFPTQYLKTFTSIMLVTKLDQVVVPSKLMIGIDSQVKDHGQLASLCTHPSLPIF